MFRCSTAVLRMRYKNLEIPHESFFLFLNLKYEQKWPKRKKQSQRCINLYSSGCTDVVLSIEGIFYVPHAIALIISGCPRIPIVGAERIVVEQIKFYRLKEIRRKFAVGLNGLHPTLFCFGTFPVEIRKSKHIRNLSLFIAGWGGGEGAGRWEGCRRTLGGNRIVIRGNGGWNQS